MLTTSCLCEFNRLYLSFPDYRASVTTQQSHPALTRSHTSPSQFKPCATGRTCLGFRIRQSGLLPGLFHMGSRRGHCWEDDLGPCMASVRQCLAKVHTQGMLVSPSEVLVSAPKLASRSGITTLQVLGGWFPTLEF